MSSPKNLVIIENPQKGMAQSPLFGIGMIRNLDISTNSGSIRLNNLPENKGSTTVTDLIMWYVQNPTNADVWAVGDTNRVYKSTDSGSSWSYVSGNNSGTGRGLAIWKDYLFVARDTAIDVYGPLSGSPSWNTTFAPVLDADSAFHPMLASIDDNLYIGAGRYVAKLAENAAPFAPGTAGSYTYTKRAISLAPKYRVKCLADLGQNLMLGTWSGVNVFDFKVADILPYPRSTLTLGIPIQLNENGVNAMITINNRLYVQAGLTGKLFVTDTVSAKLLTQIPYYAANLDGGKYLTVYPGAIMNHQGKIFFGIGNSTQVGNIGVWSYNPNDGALSLENIISTGSDGSVNNLAIGALVSISRDAYLSSWIDNASYGADKINNSLRYTSYSGYIDSALVKVGEALGNNTMPQFEINLQKPLVSGQGVKIQYRSNLTASFADAATMDFATNGGVLTHNFSGSFMTNLVFFQMRALLTTGSSNLSPELVNVLLKPAV